MLIVLVPLLAALTASPAPATTSAPAPSPLKEIGHVESLSICSAIVVHANSAIGIALDNDRELALVINRLRTTDLDDGNEIKRRNGMSDLGTLAGRIRLAAATGNGEVKRLRAMAAQTSEPVRRADLKAFADALGGAIARQRNTAVDLDKMLTIIDGRRAVEEINTSELVGQRLAVGSVPGPIGRPGGSALQSGVMQNPAAPSTPARVNDILRGVGDDFTARTQAILSDEGNAADHVLGATTGC